MSLWDLEKLRVHRLAANDLKVVSVEIETVSYQLAESEHLAGVLTAHDRVHVEPQSGLASAELLEKPEAFEGPLVVSRHAADTIVDSRRPRRGRDSG